MTERCLGWLIPALTHVRWFGGVAALCLFLVATGAMGSAAADPAMDFQLMTLAGKAGCPRDCADVIVADGEIDNETAGRFVSFLSSHIQDRDLRPVVLLQSPGGTVVGAMQLGTVFRKIGAAVIVAGTRSAGEGEQVDLVQGACVSACVYAFIGGARRVVPSISLLGIHRMAITQDVEDANGQRGRLQIFGSPDIVAALASYTKAMGVDPHMISYAETIAPEHLHIVPPREIARWRLGRPRL